MALRADMPARDFSTGPGGTPAAATLSVFPGQGALAIRNRRVLRDGSTTRAGTSLARAKHAESGGRRAQTSPAVLDRLQ